MIRFLEHCFLTVDSLRDFGKRPYISAPTGSPWKITTYTYLLGAQRKLIASFGVGYFLMLKSTSLAASDPRAYEIKS